MPYRTFAIDRAQSDYSYDPGFVPGWVAQYAITDTDITLQDWFNEVYSHGGGWMPFSGFTLNDDNSLSYSGDPDQHPRYTMQVGEQTVCMYDGAWVCIINPDRSFEISRMD